MVDFCIFVNLYQALDHMTGVLAQDRQDEEIVGYALDTLANVCSPDTFDEEDEEGKIVHEKANVGEQFTEIFLKVRQWQTNWKAKWIFQVGGTTYFLFSSMSPTYRLRWMSWKTTTFECGGQPSAF